MSGNNVNLVGNITRDPELRYTSSGQATSFFDIVCWREMAEHAAESLTRGSRVMVTGRLEQRSWETDNGDKRSKVEVIADEVGPSLRWATATVTKSQRQDGNSNGGGYNGNNGGGNNYNSAPQNNNSNNSPSYASAPADNGWGSDEEPF